MSQSTILDTQKCEHETASILNNFTIAFGKVHWGFPDFENLDELFENQQFVLMLCVKASSEKSDLYLNNNIFNVITGGVICVRRSDKILWNHCCCDNMQILWLPFTMKRVSDCSCEGADVLNDFLCGKLSSVGYNTQLIDYSDFLRKRDCSYTKCCLNQVLSGFILDCIFTLKQNYDGLTNKDKITQYLLDHATEKISVPELAKKLSISERALFYYFQDNFGSTPSNYINRIRMNAAAEHIPRGLSVKEVTEMYHFSESSAFCRLFKKYFGITPTEYRQLAEKSQLKIVSRDELKESSERTVFFILYYIVFDQSMTLLSRSGTIFSRNCSTVMAPRSPSLRLRIEMVLFSMSLSPTTTMYGTFSSCASRIL